MAREFYTIPMPDPDQNPNNDPETRPIDLPATRGPVAPDAATIQDIPLASEVRLRAEQAADKAAGRGESSATKYFRESVEAAEATADHIDGLLRSGALGREPITPPAHDPSTEKYTKLLQEVRQVANNAPQHPDGSQSTTPLRPNFWDKILPWRRSA